MLSRKLSELFFKFLSKFDNRENSKYDMWLGVAPKVLGILCTLLGLVCTVLCFVDFGTEGAIVAVLFLVLGIAVTFYSFNKWIRILSDDEFEFSNFIGKKTVYKFSDIQNIVRKNRANDMGMRQEKIILVMPKKRIPIEEECIMSNRLLEKLNSLSK